VAQDQQLQVFGGVAAGKQGEQLDGVAQHEVGELGEHEVASASTMRKRGRHTTESVRGANRSSHKVCQHFRTPRWLLVGRRHLAQVLRVYVHHHNHHRAHRALGLKPPDSPASNTTLVEARPGRVHRRDLLGGLLHEYRRAA
jgi:hypothetical protein